MTPSRASWSRFANWSGWCSPLARDHRRTRASYPGQVSHRPYIESAKVLENRISASENLLHRRFVTVYYRAADFITILITGEFYNKNYEKGRATRRRMRE